METGIPGAPHGTFQVFSVSQFGTASFIFLIKTVIHLAPMLVPLALARLATSCLPPHHSQVIKMQLATVASWFLSQLKGPRPAIQRPYKK